MDDGITITIISNDTWRAGTRTQAAKELARLDGGRVTVEFTDTDGDKHDIIDIYGRYRAFGEIQPAYVRWASPGAQFGAEDARRFAQAVIVAAEIAELAGEIAAEEELEPSPHAAPFVPHCNARTPDEATGKSWECSAERDHEGNHTAHAMGEHRPVHVWPREKKVVPAA